ncbi:hypothetical protein MRX96_007255 [Rhipicephalus microplus]
MVHGCSRHEVWELLGMCDADGPQETNPSAVSSFSFSSLVGEQKSQRHGCSTDSVGRETNSGFRQSESCLFCAWSHESISSRLSLLASAKSATWHYVPPHRRSVKKTRVLPSVSRLSLTCIRNVQ